MQRSRLGLHDSDVLYRSCVGRNLASLELLIIVASIFRRYEFVLEEPDKRVSLVFTFLVDRCPHGLSARYYGRLP